MVRVVDETSCLAPPVKVTIDVPHSDHHPIRYPDLPVHAAGFLHLTLKLLRGLVASQ